jgi:hypothetical protein
MKYYRTLAALALAVVARSASATEPDVVVGMDQACPAGTTTKGPAYRWNGGKLGNGGRFVREGWVCESLQGKN